MNIALIAHDTKKELMVQFCIAYCGVLSKHNLCATGTTGKMVAEATGLNVQRYLSGSQGGDQQIAARISCNEIDLLLFFRDPISVKPHEPNDMNLLRLCDVHNIPVATNIATATMKVDSAEKNQYDIQFYRTNGINGAEQWSDGNHTNITVNGTGFVSMSFTQSTTKEN